MFKNKKNPPLLRVIKGQKEYKKFTRLVSSLPTVSSWGVAAKTQTQNPKQTASSLVWSRWLPAAACAEVPSSLLHPLLLHSALGSASIFPGCSGIFCTPLRGCFSDTWIIPVLAFSCPKISPPTSGLFGHRPSKELQQQGFFPSSPSWSEIIYPHPPCCSCHSQATLQKDPAKQQDWSPLLDFISGLVRDVASLEAVEGFI